MNDITVIVLGTAKGQVSNPTQHKAVTGTRIKADKSVIV